MGGVEANTVYLLQGDSLLGREEAPGAVVEANGGQGAAEFYIKRDLGGSKGTEVEIRQEWQGRRRQGSIRVAVQCREQWASGLRDGDRWNPDGKMILCGNTTAGTG